MKHIYSIVWMICLFASSLTANADVLPGPEVAEMNKKWRIEFNQAVDETLLKDHIEIINTENPQNPLPLTITYEEKKDVKKDKMRFFVNVQANGLYYGKTYELRISKELKAKDSQLTLKEDLVHAFRSDETCQKAKEVENSLSPQALKGQLTTFVKTNNLNNVKDGAIKLQMCRGSSEGLYAIEDVSSIGSNIMYPLVAETDLYYFIDVYGRIMWLRKEVWEKGDMPDEFVKTANELNASKVTYKVSNNTLIRYDSQHADGVSYGKAPAFLKPNTSYYSRDASTFYDEEGNKVGTSYYYFQNVSIFMPTIYTAEELETLINKAFPKESVIVGQHFGQTLKELERTSRINALFLLAFAAQESDYGTSNKAKNYKNIYSIDALDNNTCSGIISETCTYPSIQKNAESVVQLLQKQYLQVDKDPTNSNMWQPTEYSKGAVIGNKTYGINVRYSTDPYWGIGIAKIMAQFDEELYTLYGKKERGQYEIAIFNNTDDKLEFRKKGTKNFITVVEATRAIGRPVTIIDKSDTNFYKVVSDYLAVCDDSTADHCSLYVWKNSFHTTPAVEIR